MHHPFIKPGSFHVDFPIDFKVAVSHKTREKKSMYVPVIPDIEQC